MLNFIGDMCSLYFGRGFIQADYGTIVKGTENLTPQKAKFYFWVIKEGLRIAEYIK